jgi:hypothetical protein
MPVVADALQRRACRPMQAHFILACTPVPDSDRALSAIFKITPQPPLIDSRPPTIGQCDFHGNGTIRWLCQLTELQQFSKVRRG